MEATGWYGEVWSYRELSGSISTPSGTVSTTAYTSSGSHLSWISMEATLHLEEMEGNDADFVQPAVKKPRKETESEEKMKHIKSLAREFFGEPSANCSIEGADMSVLERWLKEMGVGWVLRLADGARVPRPARLGHTLDAASNWIWALHEIVGTLCLMRSSLPLGRRYRSMLEKEEAATGSEEQVQFASFTQQAILKLLAFVDVLVPDASSNVTFINQGPVPYQKLQRLLYVREALSKTLCKIPLSFDSSPSSEDERIVREIVTVLSAKDGTVVEAIWTQLDKTRNRILVSFTEDGNKDSSATHKATRSFMKYVTLFLLANNNYWLVAPIVSEAASLGKYLPRIGDIPPVKSLALEMVSCLQEKLTNKSEQFPDQSLRFLFLLNNSSFIKDELVSCCYFPQSYKAAVTRKVEGYLENYVQVFCAPVLSCLFNPTTSLCFGKNYSPLDKFESEFQKTYTTQKLWQVPDPKLRRRLREAIIKEIVPAYTNYIEDNKASSPKFTPQDLEEMMQEMFEG
ncbi:hypothetical protein HU200_043451 [Digitaria exilis]|uniref:Exocyst subunit Exo70 family protein n=1 Tax=Digitaria exilis TaxID=1010633 RepID=A0A835EDQ9_9POAL|nr:hypothetical protein HU200_043451 [Digitaria exilis]